MITNYAIIDHVGQVSAISDMYARAYSEAIGFDKVYTLKKVCMMGSPYAKEITNKMKWYNRFNKNPKKVYIICSDAFDPKVQFVADAWADRGIEVEFITEEPEPTVGFDTVSKARRCAMIWASALGWQFSAPLFRDPYTESIDMYTARPDMEHESGSYGAKRFTRPESFINSFRAVASEEECEKFFEHYVYLSKNGLLAEFLEPGYTLCPTCGRPIFETSAQCNWCDEEFETVTIDTFWEDSYNDDPDWNYEPSRASLSNFNVNMNSADFAVKNYKRYLADCTVRDSGKFYFPESNDIKAIDYSTVTVVPAEYKKEEILISEFTANCTQRKVLSCPAANSLLGRYNEIQNTLA